VVVDMQWRGIAMTRMGGCGYAVCTLQISEQQQGGASKEGG
jgi:hypothetical protein